MNLPELLEAIKPGLTLYGVLLTFAVVSFAVWRRFWAFEKELAQDNIDRLSELVTGFRARYVEPIIRKQLQAAITGAYEITFSGLIDDLNPKGKSKSGDITRNQLPDEELRSAVSEDAMRERLANLAKEDQSVEKFLSSRSGEDLFDKLDSTYERQLLLSRQYRQACQACAQTSYAFLCLSFLFLVAMLNLLRDWPSGVTYVWLFVTIDVFGYGVFSYVRLERHRRGLLRAWEGFKIHGSI